MYEKLQRPAFYANTRYEASQAYAQADSISNINKRDGTGNDRIFRPGLLQAEILPRNLVNFDRLAAVDLESESQLITKDKDVDKIALFNVRVPDVKDTS